MLTLVFFALEVFLDKRFFAAFFFLSLEPFLDLFLLRDFFAFFLLFFFAFLEPFFLEAFFPALAAFALTAPLRPPPLAKASDVIMESKTFVVRNKNTMMTMPRVFRSISYPVIERKRRFSRWIFLLWCEYDSEIKFLVN